MDFPDIPDFLRIPQDRRRAAWAGRKLTRPSKTDITITRNEGPDTKRFRLEMEKAARAKKAERLAYLKANYGRG